MGIAMGGQLTKKLLGSKPTLSNTAILGIRMHIPDLPTLQEKLAQERARLEQPNQQSLDPTELSPEALRLAQKIEQLLRKGYEIDIQGVPNVS